ncbi:MAG: hypothetical protein ACXVZ3_10150 [Gaiellaceae bacterium]
MAVAALALAGPAAGASTATLSPNEALFGDRITATVTAPGGARVVANFGPLDVLSGPTRTGSGLTWTVACLGADCAPGAGPRRIVLPPVRLTGTVSETVPWPVLTIAGRVTPKEAAAASPPLRLETQLPRPSYRVAPDALALALDVLAGALVLAAVLLLARELARRRRRREEERLAALSPLERALVFAREAERRGPDERRKALGLLARVLGGREEQLAGTASELAWSPRKPSPEQVESLVGEVEREVRHR